MMAELVHAALVLRRQLESKDLQFFPPVADLDNGTRINCY